MILLLYDAIRIAKEKSDTELYFVVNRVTSCPTTRSIVNNLAIVDTTTHPKYKSYQHICRLAYAINSDYFYIYLEDGTYEKIDLTPSQKLLIDTLVRLPK